MDFSDVIRKRRSIRKFKPDIIPEATINKILEAARLAPSWANMQGVEYVVVNTPDKAGLLASAIGQKWTKDVSTFIVVCIREKSSGKNQSGLAYFSVDAAIAMEHIVLAATNEGLGSCWIGAFEEEKIKKSLDIPADSHVIAITPLGVPNQTPGQQNRKELRDIVYWNNYGMKKE